MSRIAHLLGAMRFVVLASPLLAACSGEATATTDAGIDSGRDAATDTPTDAGVIPSSDSGVDAGTVSAIDAGTVVGMDAGVIEAIDASTTHESDAAQERDDAGVDAGVDAARDPDAGVLDEVVQVTVGSRHSCALRVSGTVVCWGIGSELADSTRMMSPVPMAVSGITDAVEISVSCFRRAAGTVGCWGSTVRPAATPGIAPADVADLTDAVELSVTTGYACARRPPGDVACWGLNVTGGLGDGTTTARPTPAAVSGLTDAVRVRAGGGPEGHTCVVRAVGAVSCWGLNHRGQLGDGSTSHSTCVRGDCALTPVDVVGLTDAVEVAPGYSHTCARRTSGAVVCWGGNEQGQLGSGTMTDSVMPVAVSGITDAVELASGAGHTCAVHASGAVSCWGGNGNGALGDGTRTDRSTPVTVSGLTDAVGVSAGSSHVCVLRSDRTVACWGANLYGMLGDGTTTDRLTPVTVVSP